MAAVVQEKDQDVSSGREKKGLSNFKVTCIINF